MKIYLAATYARRAEMLEYASILEQLGHTITSRWIRKTYDSIKELNEVNRMTVAIEDLDDIDESDMLVFFSTESSTNHITKGGKHFELGYALRMNFEASKSESDRIKLILIGQRENVFHYLPEIEQFDDWSLFYNWIQNENK